MQNFRSFPAKAVYLGKDRGGMKGKEEKEERVY